MRIVVCLKHVLDPEIPARAFGLDESRRTPVVSGAAAAGVLDSYAENALELAIQLRDHTPGATVLCLCLGDSDSDDALRRGLAFTADAAARAWEPTWAGLDGLGVAHLLARAIQTLGGADLVLCGRQAADIEEGLVGPALAEELGVPCITLATDIEPVEGGVRVRREVDGWLESVEAPLPLVVTITSAENNVPRMPKVKDVMLARGKPIQRLGAGELHPDPAALVPGMILERMDLPDWSTPCEILDGDAAAQADALVQRLADLKLV